jgi:hypothetical protein
MEHADVATDRSDRAYETYGWVILLASALLGIFAAVLTAIPPEYMRTTSIAPLHYPIMAALTIASIGFYVFAAIVILIPYRRGERWAWYTLWMLPLTWLSNFALVPDRPFYLVLATISALGLMLPYRRFFSGEEKGSV